MNVAGIVVALVGGFFIVVALRGTQHAALPSLFPAPTTTSNSGGSNAGLPTIPAPNGGPPIGIVAS